MNVNEIASALVKVAELYLDGKIDAHEYVNEKAALWEEAHSQGVAKEVHDIVQARLKVLDQCKR